MQRISGHNSSIFGFEFGDVIWSLFLLIRWVYAFTVELFLIWYIESGIVRLSHAFCDFKWFLWAQTQLQLISRRELRLTSRFPTFRKLHDFAPGSFLSLKLFSIPLDQRLSSYLLEDVASMFTDASHFLLGHWNTKRFLLGKLGLWISFLLREYPLRLVCLLDPLWTGLHLGVAFTAKR